MDRGEGQQWSRAPGNLLSEPREVEVDPGRDEVVRVDLEKAIPDIPAPKDTKYVKHVRIQSERLTRFWGRPMHLGAVVLLPHGFDEHPEARYPLVVFHGHFPYTASDSREEPTDPNLPCVYSERFRLDCYNRIEQEKAHQLYEDWTSPGFPRFIVIEIQHANPYYDDSNAVNSQNLGPYGDAIQHELVPEVEKRFYKTLGLISFFTVGPEEVRAWTDRQESLPPQAAGVIHSDFERGFIRAEVRKYQDLIKMGSEQKVREVGKYLQKGRDYVVEDGDIINFLFNV